MAVKNMIYKLRTHAKLSQESFAAVFGVTHQAVQKWESGATVPDLTNLIKIAKHFGISLDALVFDSNGRVEDELKANKELKPKFSNMHFWELYSANLGIEYMQAMDEGLDIEKYKEVFYAVSKLEQTENKEKIADVLFNIVLNASRREDYKYIEPSTLEEIKLLRKGYDFISTKYPDKDTLKAKIHGAWMGRICGCLLGKPIECISSGELASLLKETGNFPMHRYINRGEITDEMCEKYTFRLNGREGYADMADGMPVDDDTNYVILAQELIEKYGRDFTSYDVSRVWLDLQPKDAYCTAERVAFCNFVKGFEPPESAMYKNPYREWIGAQIRGDYFGYINPGNPEMAAEMAFRDASISHTKNGIYGEMLVSAMIACAAVTDNIEDIIRGGLAQIPHTSRLYEEIMNVIDGYKKGVTYEECITKMSQKYDENSGHGMVHTISNAIIVAAALLYGEGDYGKSICLAVQPAFDTDCNGATVGSVIGMRNGIESIDEQWTKPVGDKLHTSIFGVGTVKISERAEMTMKHIV